MTDPAKKVLLVEDEVNHAKILRFNLEAAGFQTTVARDGFDGWVFAQQDEFDLVITDYKLPEVMGSDLCRRLRKHKRYAETPIILVTAFERDLDILRLKGELNLLAIFPKPNNPTEIVKVVREALGDPVAQVSQSAGQGPE